MKNVRRLITDANCFLVGGGGLWGRGAAREGGEEELENILPVRLAYA